MFLAIFSLTAILHVHGLFNALLAPLYAGSTVDFMPKFSVSGIWQRWRESYPKDGSKVVNAVTVFTGVPTMYTRLIQGYEAMDVELQASSASAASKLRLMMCGSSALPYPVMEQWESITGHRLLERYGMTEFVMAISNPLHGLRKGGTVGKPFPGVEVKILKDDGSQSDTTEGSGELCIRSPSLFLEYWKKPEVTKESFIEGGFFKTGDAVAVDEDGYYIILGRTSADIMKVGGYKLSALEIEAALLEHPCVSECCVLGLPDEAYGEAVCAIIVPDEDVKRRRQEEMKPAISLEELCTWAKHNLAPYKLPTRLYLWNSLPRNAMGKVNKKELKKLLAADQQQS
ncbi:Probable CoA ligase ccl8 [Dionaea muscipula]